MDRIDNNLDFKEIDFKVSVSKVLQVVLTSSSLKNFKFDAGISSAVRKLTTSMGKDSEDEGYGGKSGSTFPERPPFVEKERNAGNSLR